MEIKTPHIVANDDDFAKTVLMPGDPLRSKYIAENFLENAKLVNNVRGVQGYTGYYKGHKVSVMASGMGMPSMGIYSYELYTKFNVDNIIRIGSAGSLKEDVNLKQLIISTGAYTTSNFADMQKDNINYVESSNILLENACNVADYSNIKYVKGNLHTTDNFYDYKDTFKFNDALALEMEAAGLLYTAKKLNKHAIALVTISDSLITNEALSAFERQTTFNEMIKLALDLAVRMDDYV